MKKYIPPKLIASEKAKSCNASICGYFHSCGEQVKSNR